MASTWKTIICEDYEIADLSDDWGDMDVIGITQLRTGKILIVGLDKA
jgi:hypothetical protein|tara:strand:- start:255 stop:395 length:141 start_codon:yes stop_codon:yes gene_type:complete